MKEQLFDGVMNTPLEFPCSFNLCTADGATVVATVEEKPEYYELYLEILSTGEKAKILNFHTAMTVGVVLGEIERKYESVFAHVVHHRQNIVYVDGSVYENIPNFPEVK